jgi:hypothetical protein
LDSEDVFPQRLKPSGFDFLIAGLRSPAPPKGNTSFFWTTSEQMFWVAQSLQRCDFRYYRMIGFSR